MTNRQIDTWRTIIGVYAAEFRRAGRGRHYMVRVILPLYHPWSGKTHAELEDVIDRTVDGFTATEQGPGGRWALVIDTRASGYSSDWTLGILEQGVGELVAACRRAAEAQEVEA